MAMKREIPSGAILMFRLGDFYEMFGEDAAIASPILGATLTKRNGMPMCGVPYHAINSYLAKLIKAGKTAALCDQMEDPKYAKGIVRRDITRIITPGTITEDGLLDETNNNYIGATSGNSLALLDLSTGEFTVEKFPGEKQLNDAIERYSPSEMLGHGEDVQWLYNYEMAFECLTRHFKVLSLDGFGLAGENDMVSAAGALLYYVGTTLRHATGHIRKLRLRRSDDILILDSSTIRHLHLLPIGDISKNSTLLGVLDATKTPMGARMLRGTIARPLAKKKEIDERLDAVGIFVDNRSLLTSLRAQLGSVRDIERLVQKIDSNRANPRDLRALSSSLKPIPAIKEVLDQLVNQNSSTAITPLNQELKAEEELTALIEKSIIEEPPALMNDGGYIAEGWNAELDEVRNIARKGHQWIAEYQSREQQRTGITKLKVKHVSTFGFVIEIPKGSVSMTPADYERRQTLTTGERYTTPELKEYESKVLGAQDRAIAIEQRLFGEIVAKIREHSARMQESAQAIGKLDAIMSLADRALALGYVRPEIDDSDVLEIKDGRHPIIEQLPDAEPFVPNSTYLNCTTDQINLLTGPNMAGKSTYIRQVATIAAMAQCGSWVPCSSMRIGVLDRIFTRIGAGDDLSRGRSTFLVEMQETAEILNNATTKSLIILDEIGRGTSTFDGISIAWSVAEYIHGKQSVKAKTLFATHYHELTDLSTTLKGVKNYTVKVKEDNGRIVFLRRIVPGVAEKSFGIHVGAMAGLPQEVVERATQILKNLEANDIDINAPTKVVRKPRGRISDLPGQMTFFN